MKSELKVDKMLQSYPIFVEDNALDKKNDSFSVEEMFWLTDKYSQELLYQQITCEVLSKPKQLTSHVKRIHLTRNNKDSDRLYAALVDLLWVLNGKGKELSHRMVAIARPFLTEQQINLLVEYLSHDDNSFLSGNKFSVLTDGVIGTRCLLSKQASNTIEHDPLKLANDFIEFSQLDEAIDVLEKGILLEPERQELQNQLLELYKVTRKGEAFTKMLNTLIEQQFELSTEWQDLAAFFSGKNNEG